MNSNRTLAKDVAQALREDPHRWAGSRHSSEGRDKSPLSPEATCKLCLIVKFLQRNEARLGAEMVRAFSLPFGSEHLHWFAEGSPFAVFLLGSEAIMAVPDYRNRFSEDRGAIESVSCSAPFADETATSKDLFDGTPSHICRAQQLA
jgi:hypothetical protein